MFGVILVSIGAFFVEIFDSIGKRKVANHEQSKFTMGFLGLFWGIIFMLIIGLVNNEAFIFQLASLPTFLVRAILEIAQAYVTILAIIKADRTTFGFVRIITIPLLLLVDIFLGYDITYLAMGGIAVIVIGLLILFLNRKIKKDGFGLVLFSAVNAVITISLFKYDITHFNSVAAEQAVMHTILLIFFAAFAIIKAHENPFAFLLKPAFFFQSIAVGIGGVLESFAFNYGAASVITAVKRAASIFWSIVFGGLYFKEHSMILKLAVFAILVVGICFLSI